MPDGDLEETRKYLNASVYGYDLLILLACRSQVFDLNMWLLAVMFDGYKGCLSLSFSLGALEVIPGG